jgi:hypothetical protein
MPEYFVEPGSIVRKIWGRTDNVLLIFAASAAEFSLNNAVDWLFFTGKIPAKPIARMISTVEYASHILFSEEKTALATIKAVRQIHGGVENARKMNIPDAAYRDILNMLIDYSIKSHELLNGAISDAEKAEVFIAFKRFGNEMGIPGIPDTYFRWELERAQTLKSNFNRSTYTVKLQESYRKNLGELRYWILVEIQKMMLDPKLLSMLQLTNKSWLRMPIGVYTLIKNSKVALWLIMQVIPKEFQKNLKQINKY